MVFNPTSFSNFSSKNCNATIALTENLMLKTQNQVDVNFTDFRKAFDAIGLIIKELHAHVIRILFLLGKTHI